MHAAMGAIDHLVRHQVSSGLSLGVFDTEFGFARAESHAAAGRLWWDAADGGAGPDALLAQMDFPLVSVALAYDAAHPLDPAEMAPLVRALPLYATFYAALERLDARPRAAGAADGPGQLLLRNATNTRPDHQGRGLAKRAAHYMMRAAAARGFRAVQIETLSDAFERIWANPPSPFAARVVSAFEVADYEELDEATGAKTYPFRPARQRATKIYCAIRGEEGGGKRRWRPLRESVRESECVYVCVCACVKREEREGSGTGVCEQR